jgi:hypothetical protein
LALEVPNSFFSKDWLLEPHLDVIKAAQNSASGRTLIIDYTIITGGTRKISRTKTASSGKILGEKTRGTK